MASGELFVGVDLGGTTMTVALIDENGLIHAEAEEPTLAVEGAEALVGRIVAGIRKLMAQKGLGPGAVAGIGMGVPGLIDTARGVALLAPNLHWENVPVADLVARELGMPVRIQNDVRCAALGEKRFGAGRGVDNLVLITLGTGIGSGIFLNGQLWTGPGGYAGEAGHITVEAEGPACACGNRGCVEAFSGRFGIIRRAKEALAQQPSAKLLDLVQGDPDRLTPALLHQAAVAGDKLAAKVLEDTGRYVGIGMASVVNLLNPERIIVGGGVARAGELILEPIRKEIRQRAVRLAADMVEVVPAQLGAAAGVIGASTLVHQNGN